MMAERSDVAVPQRVTIGGRSVRKQIKIFRENIDWSAGKLWKEVPRSRRRNGWRKEVPRWHRGNRSRKEVPGKHIELGHVGNAVCGARDEEGRGEKWRQNKE